MNTSFELRFEANTLITQQVHIVDADLSAEDIVAGLESGRFATTVGHDGGDRVPTIDEVATGRTVAEIVGQDSDGEYMEFEVAD